MKSEKQIKNELTNLKKTANQFFKHYPNIEYQRYREGYVDALKWVLSEP